MKRSKLVLALIGGIVLPLGVLAQSYQSGTSQGGSAQGGSQYGTSQSDTSQSGATQSQSGSSMNQQGSTMNQPGSMGGSESSTSRRMNRNAPTGAEGSAGLPMFDGLDTNKDGFISKTEAKKSTVANKKFRDLDTNHDGKISSDEWQAGGGQTSNQ